MKKNRAKRNPREVLAAARAVSESIPERTERIAHDHNISRVEALRVAIAESNFERKRAKALAQSITEPREES